MDAKNTPRTQDFIGKEARFGARNYAPVPVVVDRAKDCLVWDVEGREYIDMMSAYSAVSHGHLHPRLVAAAHRQLERVAVTSRAYHDTTLGPFLEKLCKIAGFDRALPMNTGAEAVETAIKLARRWGYQKKGIAADQAEIIVCRNNFHGRTTTVISFSSEEAYRDGFGPFTAGFRIIPFGDAKALEAAITPNTCAFLFEPIQCEAGILIPPAGFLKEASEICRRNNVLLIADEIQTGLGRTGEMFACWREDVQPDAFILGKALSGGFYPVSAVVSSREVLGVFNPGSHGSTYGGNPLGCAVAREALRVLEEERLCERSRELGAWFLDELRTIRHEAIREVRGIGLLTGIELHGAARPYCERLMQLGLLCKETHDHVIRIAPPLMISREDLEWAVARVKETFAA